jgi:small subunit ribosomal protein S15
MSSVVASKQEVVEKFRRSGADSGSPDVQIALLTSRINSMTEHMRLHTKDYASRRGLLRMVSRRRSLLDYVRKHDPNRYLDLIGQLNIRK